MYNEDRSKYGEPTETTFVVTEIAKVANWQRILNNHASKVEPSGEKGSGAKRKRS
jgi:hypothetical protein